MLMIKLNLPFSLHGIYMIVNKSLMDGYFAETWKCATKTSDIIDFSELRPIRILPDLSKIMKECA